MNDQRESRKANIGVTGDTGAGSSDTTSPTNTNTTGAGTGTGSGGLVQDGKFGKDKQHGWQGGPNPNPSNGGLDYATEAPEV